MYLLLGKESEGLRVVLTAASRRTKAVPSYHAELWHSSGAAALHSLWVGSELSLRLRSALIFDSARLGHWAGWGLNRVPYSGSCWARIKA